MSDRKSKTTPKRRITQFNNKHLYKKNNQLWCRPCNVVVGSAKKSSIEQHLVTQTHIHLSSIVDSNKKPKFENSNRNQIKQEFSRDLMTAFARANIPTHKLENKVLRKTLSKYLKDEVANAWPSTTTVRKTLPDIHSSELELLKNSMKGKKIAIFADETTDCEQRYVLNVLILDLDFTKASKPLLTETFFLEVKYHKTVTFLIYIKLLL